MPGGNYLGAVVLGERDVFVTLWVIARVPVPKDLSPTRFCQPVTLTVHQLFHAFSVRRLQQDVELVRSELVTVTVEDHQQPSTRVKPKGHESAIDRVAVILRDVLSAEAHDVQAGRDPNLNLHLELDSQAMTPGPLGVALANHASQHEYRIFGILKLGLAARHGELRVKYLRVHGVLPLRVLDVSRNIQTFVALFHVVEQRERRVGVVQSPEGLFELRPLRLVPLAQLGVRAILRRDFCIERRDFRLELFGLLVRCRRITHQYHQTSKS
jgi:hypothetical protein